MKRLLTFVMALGLTSAALAQDAVFQTKALTPETALKAASTVLEF